MPDRVVIDCLLPDAAEKALNLVKMAQAEKELPPQP
jgi:hypothetical protein